MKNSFIPFSGNSRALLVFLLFSALSITAAGQVVYSGVVRGEAKESLADVYITLSQKSSEIVLKYAITDAQGSYTLQYSGNADSVCIKVARLDYEKQSVCVPNRSRELNFNLKVAVNQLPEITVRAKNVWLKSDTVNYSVAAFAGRNDRTIAEVLQKMPGIEVGQSGQIKYNGSPISNFYVENMDLMNGQYGVVTNNLGNKHVSTVQVYENHQPIKSMKEHNTSDGAAINLVLTETARSRWITSVKLGLGFAPLLWDCEATTMRFAKGSQGIYSFKTNNVGKDIAADLTMHYGAYGATSKQTMLAIPTSQPSLPQKRYLFNNANMLTINQLWKLSDNYQLRFNADYINDYQTKSMAANTTYYDNDEKVEVSEKSQTALNINKVKAGLTLTGNHSKYYLLNELKGQYDWSDERALINTSNQYLKTPYFNVSNDFSWMKTLKNVQLSILFNNKGNSSPQSLSIHPGLYDSIFNNGNPYDELRQKATLSNYVSEGNFRVTKAKKRWLQLYTLGYHFQWQQVKSELGMPDTNIADSLQNNLSYLQSRVYFQPEWIYTYKDWRVTARMPAGMRFLKTKNAIEQINETEKEFYINPSLQIRYKIGVLWEAFAMASYNDGYSDINDLYTGYILTSYRSILKNSDSFSKTKSQSYSLNLTYRDPLKLSNALFSASYGIAESNFLYQQSFDGILSIRNKTAYNSKPVFAYLSASYSKGFERFVKKAGVQLSYNYGSAEQLQNDLIATFRQNMFLSAFSIETEPAVWVGITYNLNFSTSNSSIKTSAYSSDNASIKTWRQQLRTFFFPIKGFQIGVNMELENNSGIKGVPATFFMDMEAKYSFKKYEVALGWSNIWNEKYYTVSNYGDFFVTHNVYELRPANVIVSLRLSL